MSGILHLQHLHELQRVISQDAAPEPRHRISPPHPCLLYAQVQDTLERTLFVVLLVLDMVLFATSLFVPLERLVKAEYFRGSSGCEETCQVSGSVVLQHCLGTVTRKLCGCRLCRDLVSEDGCIGNLHNEPSVGEANGETELLRVTFGLLAGSSSYERGSQSCPLDGVSSGLGF